MEDKLIRVPVYFAVGFEVTNIRSPSILFIKLELYCGCFASLRNSLIIKVFRYSG